MHLEMFETIRRNRFVNLVLLVVCVALAGLLWSHAFDRGQVLENSLTQQHDYWVLMFAVLFTTCSLILAFGHEMLAAKLQNRAEEVHAMHHRLTEDMAIHHENAKGQERIIQTLSNENHDLRQQLLANQLREMHDRQAREQADSESTPNERSQLPSLRADQNTSTRFRRSG